MSLLNKTSGSCLIYGIIFCLFSSCSSLPSENPMIFTGRVCGDGQPVENYRIKTSSGETFTDRNGIFFIEKRKKGNFLIEGRGKGWTSFLKEVSFNDEKSVWCIQISSSKKLYSEIEKDIKNHLYDKALSRIQEETKYGEHTEMLDFYRHLCMWKKDNYQEERQWLISFLEKKSGQ